VDAAGRVDLVEHAAVAPAEGRRRGSAPANGGGTDRDLNAVGGVLERELLQRLVDAVLDLAFDAGEIDQEPGVAHVEVIDDEDGDAAGQRNSPSDLGREIGEIWYIHLALDLGRAIGEETDSDVLEFIDDFVDEERLGALCQFRPTP
jgi:hypothetical protein